MKQKHLSFEFLHIKLLLPMLRDPSAISLIKQSWILFRVFVLPGAQLCALNLMPFTSEHDISLDEVFWHRWIFGPLLLNLHSPHLFELSIEDWEGITVFDTELDASLNIFLDFLHITLRINCLALCFLLVSIGEVTLFGLIVWEGNSDSERAPVLWVEAHIEKGVRKFSISHVEVKALGLWNRLLTLFACWLLVLPGYAN